MRHFSQQASSSKLDRLWQGFVIILLAVALPLFFSFVNDAQIEQALINSTPVPDGMQASQSKQVVTSVT